MIGIIGEDPNDTTALINLLERYYDVKLKVILNNLTGSQLDSNKAKRMFKTELEPKKYDFIIYSRDLDGLRSETAKIKKAQKWFEGLDKLHENAGILLLHIYELEALILADIATFNDAFGTKIKFKNNPESQKDPKGFLTSKTRKAQKKYRESDSPNLFKKLDKATLEKNCQYFREFIEKFEEKLS